MSYIHWFLRRNTPHPGEFQILFNVPTVSMDPRTVALCYSLYMPRQCLVSVSPKTDDMTHLARSWGRISASNLFRCSSKPMGVRGRKVGHGRWVSETTAGTKLWMAMSCQTSQRTNYCRQQLATNGVKLDYRDGKWQFS